MTVWVIVIVYNSGHTDRREYVGSLSDFLDSFDEDDMRSFSASPKRVAPENQLKLPTSPFGEDLED